MEAVFGRVLEISLSGSVIAAVVLALRLALRRAPKRVVCLLWMLAVLRLLVPFEIQSDWSLQPEVESQVFTQTLQTQEELGYFDSGPISETMPAELVEDAVEYPAVPIEMETQQSPMEILGWVWLVGAAALAVHGLVSFLRLKRRVREAVILEEGIWVCPGLDTAFVLGFFRPRIYLPVLGKEERELVLLHERCHIRRLDHWWKMAAYAAVSLHWFNPLAWVTYILLCRDMEMACDQETVRTMDNAQRRAYSAALLHCAARRSGIAVCPVAFGEISVKARIKTVLNYRKPKFWVTLIALIAAIAVGICFLTSPKELTDLERCEQALKQWQAMDDYNFEQVQSNVGEMALDETSRSEYWSSGGTHLWRFEYAEGLGEWRQWIDGECYGYEFGSADADWEDTGWRGDDFEETMVIPWIMRLDWDKLTVHHWEAADDGKTVLLTVDFPTLGAGTMSFYFADSGELRNVSRTFTGADSTVSSGTIELVKTDRAKIEEEMDQFGVPEELVQLYSELERLQGMDDLHLSIEKALDSDYPGWDAGWEELIRCGEDYYCNQEVQTSGGTIIDTFVKYNGVLHAREYSESGVVQNRDWEEITDRGFGEDPLLTKDWTLYEVLDIQRGADGSAVITLQGDLSDAAENTTYYSKTYEFHLDRQGKLTAYGYNASYRMIVDDSFAQGVYDMTYKVTAHILDTPKEELEKRILEAYTEVLETVG